MSSAQCVPCPTRLSGDRRPADPFQQEAALLTVDGRQRVRLFSDAIRLWPAGVPVNVIMFPMEGDWQASAAYWILSANTGGTYMSPSRDWP